VSGHRSDTGRHGVMSLHEHRGRIVRARAPRTPRCGLGVLRPWLQVRARSRAAARRASAPLGFGAMPFYQRLGDIPRKRHIQFRENGTLLTEEVMGLEGFTGNESILYHLQSPCRVMKLDGFQPIERK